ncbi:MAG TPA: acyl-CoA dehydrogenase family protein [Terriglobales bacterium]|nr:acyl-CoA dehydrogenase family protein [Terriglobales bacterium]
MASSFDILRSPLPFLQATLGDAPRQDWLRAYEEWWQKEGQGISDAVDRGGTPWVRMFDRLGDRVDEILYPPEYWRMLQHGYRSGVLWRAFEQESLLPAYLGIYVTSFYDPGLSCPYTVSLGTIAPLMKYGEPELQARFLPRLLERQGTAWQGATWMTEIKGGSDLGANVETVARRAGDHWRLTGDKYFASNAGAELAVVAARPEGAPQNVRGLALYLVPRQRTNGQLNYFIRRLKDKVATRSVPTGEIELRDSEAWLLGTVEQGIYLILEVLNTSRVANSMGSVALAQRAMADALSFAERRVAFGKPILEQPLLHKQFEDRLQRLRAASRLAWEAVELLNQVWRDKPPYSERYHLFRLLAHLAKYWTAEFAVQTAKWAMEVHGGLGTLQEYPLERWLREAMILAIWEGTSHRQILDGLEVMERKGAHRALMQHLAGGAPASALRDLEARVDELLSMPTDQKQAAAESLFSDLAAFTADALLTRTTQPA